MHACKLLEFIGSSKYTNANSKIQILRFRKQETMSPCVQLRKLLVSWKNIKGKQFGNQWRGDLC